MVGPTIWNGRPDFLSQRLGMTSSIEVTPAGLGAKGFLMASTSVHAREVIAQADDGYEWQASIGIRFLAGREIYEGDSAVVNGRKGEGPAFRIVADPPVG